MNYVFPAIIIISFAFAAFSGNIQNTLTAGINGAASSFEVLLSFAGIMCFWSGILKVAEKSGASGFLERLLSPVTRLLFPKKAGRQHITMNISANLLGMGNAATPAGISAMRALDEENNKSAYPSREMCRFVLLNTASLQLIPTTVLGILSSQGSKNPFGIIPLIWISSALSLIAALFAEAVLFRFSGKKGNKKCSL